MERETAGRTRKKKSKQWLIVGYGIAWLSHIKRKMHTCKFISLRTKYTARDSMWVSSHRQRQRMSLCVCVYVEWNIFRYTPNMNTYEIDLMPNVFRDGGKKMEIRTFVVSIPHIPSCFPFPHSTLGLSHFATHASQPLKSSYVVVLVVVVLVWHKSISHWLCMWLT